MAGIVPGLVLALMFRTYVGLNSKFSSDLCADGRPEMSFGQKLANSRGF